MVCAVPSLSLSERKEVTVAYPRHTCLNDSCQVTNTHHTAAYLWNSRNLFERKTRQQVVIHGSHDHQDTCVCACLCQTFIFLPIDCLTLPHLWTSERNKVGGTLRYLSLHVCLCCCLSVKADSRVSAISILSSPAWPSSSTEARKSLV